MNISASSVRKGAGWLAILVGLIAIALLSGCVAANEPASSNETDRQNDGGEPTKPVATETFTAETVQNTETARATVPTHLTMTANGTTTDVRYNVDEVTGTVGKTIVSVSGPNAYDSTTTYIYDEKGVLTGGDQQINGTVREFTATVDTKQDGANVDYTETYTYNAPPMYDGDNRLVAVDQNLTKVVVEYEIDEHGHVVEYTDTRTFTMGVKTYEQKLDANFDENALITKCDVDVEEVGGANEGETELTFAYSDENRTVTKTDKRDDGSDEVTTLNLAYNEIGQLFRISGDGVEGTIEYYETPCTALVAAIVTIIPALQLV